jgi:hypothetical protein
MARLCTSWPHFAAIAASVVLVAPSARAQDHGAALHLVVRGGLPAEALRAALSQDTRRAVVLDDDTSLSPERVTIALRAEGEIAVTFDAASGSTTRIIHASGDAMIGDAALLAASLTVGIEIAPPPPPPPVAEIAPPPPIPSPPPPPSVAIILPPPPIQKDVVGLRTTTLPASASFFYPLAANWGQPNARTFFDLNVLYGRYGEIDGGQIGVMGSTGELRGVQIHGIGSHASGRALGLQIGGVFTSADSLEGLQIGGVVNHASHDVDGTQIGLINVAGGRVRGAQIGLVNVADDIEGVPIGLVSVTKSGGVHPVTWASTTTYANVGLKLATRHTYTMFSASMSMPYGHEAWGGGFTLGGRATIGKTIYLDFDLGLTTLAQPTTGDVLFYPKTRALLGARFDKHFSIFAGAGIATEARIYNHGADLAVSLMPDFAGGVEL